MNLKISRIGYWIVGSILAIVLLLPFFLPKLVGTMPHAHCYLWRTDLMWLHGGSDGLIGIAYMAISTTLFILLYRIRESIPFRWMIFAFGAFIIACGMTHFLSVWTLWEPVYYLSGSVKGVTAVASIITALTLPPLVPRIIGVVQSARTSEERRKELEVLYERVRTLDEERSRFFANISHDLRTPISLIMTPIELLLEQDDLPDGVRERLSSIRRNTQSLNDRVDDLFDLTLLDAETLRLNEEEGDLAALVRRVVGGFQGVAEVQDVELSIEAPEFLPARFDHHQIERVLQNLISNALRFVPDNGRIEIRLEHIDEVIRLEVRDNGPGVPVEDRERLFERFTQGRGQIAENSGSGLGLAISKSFVELHGGSIEIDESPGGGALLRVVLPGDRYVASSEFAGDAQRWKSVPAVEVAVPQKPAPSTPPAATELNADRPTVLLIEDNPDVRMYTVEVLEENFTVLPAESAEEGLAILDESVPTVIISDVMMPGMGGEELLSRIRSRDELKHVPVMFLSARGEAEMRVRLLQSGAQEYLSKPFSPQELRTRVAGLVAIREYQQTMKRLVSEKEASLAEATAELQNRKELLEQALLDLRKAENRFDLLWNSNVVAMGISHLDGRISEANDRFLSMIGYTREDLDSGRITISGITRQESMERTDHAISQLRDYGRIEAFEKIYRHREGWDVPAFVGAATMHETEANIFIALDLSAIREAEQEILKLNEELEDRVEQRTEELRNLNRDLRAFSYSVSHDLRAPLRAIDGFARFLREDYRDQLGETGRDYLTRIERNIRVMEEMITALLGLSRATREPIHAEVHDVHETVQEIIATLRSTDPDRIVVFDVESTLPVEADRKLFRLVLENLLQNAWKFTKNEPSARISITANDRADAWQLAISDNGAGFDQEKVERIFEPFGRLHSSSEYSGTGIGLATVHAVIRRHSGSIEAEGSTGVGARFVITLPRPAQVQQEEIDEE